MSSVKASPALDPSALVARAESAARQRGFRIERFGERDGCPLIALTRRTTGPRPRIYLSAGSHGDEPAPPETVVRLIESGVFDARANWFIAPLLNPSGFRLGTRENAEAIDLNRDYRHRQTQEVASHVRWLESQPRFDLAFCLHEDWEAVGFYLYELNPDDRPSLAQILAQAAQQHLPIDPGTVIDGRPIAEPGIIRPEHDPLLREQWPEAIYLRAHHTSLCYTIESPSGAPFERRVAALSAAVTAALTAFCHSAAR